MSSKQYLKSIVIGLILGVACSAVGMTYTYAATGTNQLTGATK